MVGTQAEGLCESPARSKKKTESFLQQEYIKWTINRAMECISATNDVGISGGGGRSKWKTGLKCVCEGEYVDSSVPPRMF